MKLAATPRQSSVLSGVLLVVLTACLVIWTPSGAHATGEPDETAAPGQAWVRVGHFVPGMGATSIDLEPVGGTGRAITLAGSATYGEVSSYDTLAPGSYTATVRDSGAEVGSAPMLQRSFEVTANDARTVAVLGTAAAPRLVLLTDDLTLPEAGTARVRLLSAAEAADPVTVTAVGGPTIAQGAVLGQATDYATVPAGAWTLQLEAATTTATLQDVPVTSGSVYTVVVLDSGNQGVELDVVTDAAGAVTAPRGGAQTGGGGTATAVTDPALSGSLPLVALAGVLVLALGAARGVRGGPILRRPAGS